MSNPKKISVRFLENREVWKIGAETVAEIRQGRCGVFAIAFGKHCSAALTFTTARRCALRAIRARRKAFRELEMPDVFAK